MKRLAPSLGLATVMILSGCARRQELLQPAAALPQPEPPRVELQNDGQPEPGSGKAMWAKQYPGALIAGLDGSLYAPYRPKMIRRIQRALASRGLYTGPVNGVLDEPTMRAIYEFQKLAGTLQVCGVPTPRTRRLLEQGSHTDPW